MLMATLVWLLQAPTLPAAVPFTPSVQEWSLGGAFKLKQEKFLVWAPAYDILRGWHVELRPTWIVELTPTHPRLSRLSLAVESNIAGAAGGIGMVRPRLQYKVGKRQTRVGVELPIATLVNTASGFGLRTFRPFAFISGRF
ncbi:MAG TPA: hypothetical protein VGB85_18720 [Nannocystis sp.]|jgi:hypothetical protein